MVDGLWNLAAPPWFRGFDPDGEWSMYQRFLPHWRQDGASYFVTFRLNDALPISKQRELNDLRNALLAKAGACPASLPSGQIARQLFRQFDSVLDCGYGECWLANSMCSDLVVEAFKFFDDERYELICFIVMPNHVHLVLRPLFPERFPLEKILQSWKGFTAYAINKTIGRKGVLWQPEYFDRIIRDEEHLYRIIQYIGRNARLAGVSDFVRWLSPKWIRYGWKFED